MTTSVKDFIGKWAVIRLCNPALISDPKENQLMGYGKIVAVWYKSGEDVFYVKVEEYHDKRGQEMLGYRLVNISTKEIYEDLGIARVMTVLDGEVG